MHILHITLHNFRSFKQQGELPQGFSPGTNAIVGRNGSGKSNWLQAVQFCLGLGPFAVLRAEERQAILHEGSGRAAVHAFVEVVLDNSQHRLAVAATTVTIRRTIGWKKDEFFLQRQRCTKQEITSLLEGAGFSKQNPYYIVQQGKVQALCTMSDLERLRLLQQVAGTVLYDEKKRDSVSHMNDNQGRLDQVNDVLQEMQDKLTDLESEKQELQAYQKADRQRRALSYALYEKECTKARRQLAQIDEERQTHLTNTLQQLHHDVKSVHDRIRNIESSVLPVSNASLKRWNQQVQRTRKQNAANRTTLQTRQDKLHSMQGMLDKQKAEVEANRSHAEELQAQLTKAERQLEDVKPMREFAEKELKDAQQERREKEESIQGFYAKQGRANDFTTAEERDTFLQTQIQEIQEHVDTRRDKLAQHRQTIQSAAENQEKENSRMEKVQSQISEKSKHLADLTKSSQVLKEKQIQLQNSRTSAWTQVGLVGNELKQAQEAFNAAQLRLSQSRPRSTSDGLRALPDLKRRLGITDRQCFGTVLENLSLTDSKYQSCVEMAAQNALFHVIVDTDETSARIVQALEQQKCGRLTFLPLSRLSPRPVADSIASDDVRSLLSDCIQHDPAVKVAMLHVFGQKWLARSSDIAAEVCRRHEVDVVTLDGDLCSSKGAMTGGYLDAQKSRFAAHIQHKEAESILEKKQAELQEAQNELQRFQTDSQTCQHSIQRQNTQQDQLRHQKEQLLAQLAACKSKLESLSSDSQQATEQVGEEETALKTGESELQRLQSELGTPLDTNLSEHDERLLQTAKDALDILMKETLPEAQSKSSKLKLQEQKLRLEVKQLDERLGQLVGSKKDVDEDAEEVEQVDEETIVELQQHVEEAKMQYERGQEDAKNAQASFAEAKENWNGAKHDLEKYKQEDENLAKALEEANEKAERLLNKRSMCISKRETYTRKIQELGSLPPPSELEKYGDKTISELMKMLESVNKKLKKYSHVNKKAFDQFVNFSEQRETLLKRKDELDQGAAKVKELIDSLDRQKDEAINRTFRGVSSHFRDVFKELVPNGAGELIMRTAMDEDDEDMDDDEESTSPKKSDPNNPDVSLYRGIGIKVRFSAVGENYMMSQLSGGQKALVALALIFSIQRCDPAPFYMFDELDQALDSTYRAAVANLIQRQANDKENPTQFIVTTFRPELVAVSNRCYGVSHQNKVSSIHSLSRKDALKFVANLMNEEEAVGEVATMAGSKTSRSTMSRKRKVASEIAQDESVTA